MSTQNHQTETEYLDIQAEVGITKHIGGFDATDTLLAQCHISDAKKVLYVGSGIGVGPTYIAKKYACIVVAVDISEKMLSWSRLRAKEEKVSHKTEFRYGNVLSLPFEDNCYDAVIVESVIVFVEEKGRAIQECIRVVKPGGMVGLNETFWRDQPTAQEEEALTLQFGAKLPPLQTWETLWEESGLVERIVTLFRINLRKEVRDRVRWVGMRWAFRAYGRLIRLYLSNSAARNAIRQQMGSSGATYNLMGYGLFVGKKAG